MTGEHITSPAYAIGADTESCPNKVRTETLDIRPRFSTGNFNLNLYFRPAEPLLTHQNQSLQNHKPIINHFSYTRTTNIPNSPQSQQVDNRTMNWLKLYGFSGPYSYRLGPFSSLPLNGAKIESVQPA